MTILDRLKVDKQLQIQDLKCSANVGEMMVVVREFGKLSEHRQCGVLDVLGGHVWEDFLVVGEFLFQLCFAVAQLSDDRLDLTGTACLRSANWCAAFIELAYWSAYRGKGFGHSVQIKLFGGMVKARSENHPRIRKPNGQEKKPLPHPRTPAPTSALKPNSGWPPTSCGTTWTRRSTSMLCSA